MFPFLFGYQDQDNFVRNLVTVLFPFTAAYVRVPTGGTAAAENQVRSIATPRDLGDPILNVDEIKTWCHIESDQDAEDDLLTTLEIAARLHTENYLRRLLDPDTVTANIKQAMCLLIAHWYRNREAICVNELYVVPHGYDAILMPERDYPLGVY
jgi:uncharacterized phage protein (predicted DNA packaging)